MILHYNGLLNQAEFITRYSNCKARIETGFTQEDVSFLLGKHSYFYCEYEQMKDCTHLGELEKEKLSQIFTLPFCNQLEFAIDDYGYSQKRLIRGVRASDNGTFQYTIYHPWFIYNDKKKGIKENLPLELEEVLTNLDEYQEMGCLIKIRKIISDLMNVSFFQEPRHPYKIYKTVKEMQVEFSPNLLKKVMYEAIANNILRMKTIEDQIHYQV